MSAWRAGLWNATSKSINNASFAAESLPLSSKPTIKSIAGFLLVY